MMKRSLTLLLLQLLQIPAVALICTETYLERLVQASSLSYLPVSKMSSSPYLASSQLKPIQQVVDPTTESGATIFKDCADKTRLIVACRGSVNPKNFGTNLKFNLVPATRLSQEIVPDNALVHEGFQVASLGLWRQLGPPLMEIVSSEETQFSELVFTGHSLGAATALLCSVHYQASASGLQPLPTIITFGGPRLCNGPLANHLRNVSLRGCDILHLVHRKDPVLANNKKLWDNIGFENVGIELECDPDSPTVYTDVHSTKIGVSSRFNFAWNLAQHCRYLGIFVGPRLI
eukprot:scaffold2315_cov113-Cylindrotheca_fusiformis.AAC.6